ncbi:S8 family serine peptidase [Hirschia litorea]|uniref:S8 family serine peptidase n=1 Tax=Hirschia litorea TaxID=1199156 RepID=A0ABW2IMA0_9PROT
MRLKVSALLCVFSLLASCGGGGGSAPTPAPTTDPVQPTDPTPPVTQTASLTSVVETNLPIVADADNNDEGSPQTNNNTAASAQSINNGSLVLGYVTKTIPQDGADLFGYLGNNGQTDEVDYFRVNLLGGETIQLEIALEESDNPSNDTIDPASGIDLDLELLDVNDNSIVVSDSTTSALEEIIVPEDGEYLIKVVAASGSSMYGLAVGGKELSSASVTQITTRHIAPGIAVVTEQERVGKSSLRSTSREGTYKSLAFGSRTHLDLEPYFASTISTQGASRQSAKSLTRLDRQRATLAAIKAINMEAGRTVLEPYVFPRKVQLASPSLYDPVPSENTQWNLSDIEWQSARTTLEGLTITHTPVIAVIDSGFLTSHPDLADRIVDQRDFVAEEYDGDGFDAEAEEIVDVNDEYPDACHEFHGTHVASIALGEVNDIGMMGVYPEAKLMALKVGYSKSIGPDGTDSEGENCEILPGDIANAIRYAAQLPLVGISGVPTASVKADVINLSLGTNSPNSNIRAAINEATAAGVIVVAAAGNEGGTALGKSRFYPAAYDNTISVASSNLAGGQSFYSSEYAEVDITAPGGDIRADVNRDGIADGIIGASASLEDGNFETSVKIIQGTSMAAPHVAGAVAMMRAIDPTLTTAEFEEMLRSGVLTTEAEDAGFDFQTGYGSMSLPRMINAAQGNGSLNPVTTLISANPKDITIDFSSRTAKLDIRKIGNDALAVSTVTPNSNPEWLSVSPSSDVDADKVGIYNLNADTTGLTGNYYTGSVQISLSDAQNLNVSVALLRDPTLPASPAAIFPTLYGVLQQKNETTDRFEQVGDTLRDLGGNSASFTFEDVPHGEEYRILISTDLDGDSFICSNGEMCGVFPDFDRPNVTFEVDGNTTQNIEISYMGRGGPIGSSTAIAAAMLSDVSKEDLEIKKN